jgi:hypothetical protein
MRDFLYNLLVSVRHYWYRFRDLSLYWICAVTTDERTGLREYKYYPIWAKSKSDAIIRTKIKLDQHYRSPYIRIECKAGYTRNDIR